MNLNKLLGNIVAETLFLVIFPGVAKLAENKRNVLLSQWLNKETLFWKRVTHVHYNKPTFEEVWGDFFFCYRACSLTNFDLVLPYFVPIHPVLSYNPQQSCKAMSNSLSLSFQFLSFFLFSSTSTSPSAIIVCLHCNTRT